MGELDIRQDINFFENPPYASCTDVFDYEERQDKDNPRHRYHVYVFRSTSGYQLECKIGVPSFFDHLVLMALFLECRNNNFNVNIELTRYGISKTIGRQKNKKVYKKIDGALDIWQDAIFSFKNSFHVRGDLPGGGHFSKKISASFSPIDAYSVRKEGKTEILEIRMGQEYVDFMRKTNFCKHVSLEEYRKFKSAVSARLFDLLTKSFHKRDEWPIEAINLAPKLTLPPNLTASKIVERIGPAINNINNICTEQYGWEKEKRGTNDILIRFKKLAKKPKPTQGDLFDSADKNDTPALKVDTPIPEHILSLVPSPQKGKVSTAWNQFLYDLPEEEVVWYIEETRKADQKKTAKGEPIKSWGSWIRTIWEAKAYETYAEAMLAVTAEMDAKRKAEAAQEKADKLKQQESDRNLKEGFKAKQLISDMDSELLLELDEYIKSIESSPVAQRLIKEGKMDTMRLANVHDFLEQRSKNLLP
jgi:hypothetical protein